MYMPNCFTDMDKSLAISPNTLMLLSGPNGDTVNFGEYIQKNLKLNTLRNGTSFSHLTVFLQNTLSVINFCFQERLQHHGQMLIMSGTN